MHVSEGMPAHQVRGRGMHAGIGAGSCDADLAAHRRGPPPAGGLLMRNSTGRSRAAFLDAGTLAETRRSWTESTGSGGKTSGHVASTFPASGRCLGRLVTRNLVPILWVC